MPEFGLRGLKKIAAGTVAFLLLSTLLFSILFIAFESHHDCSGEDDCCICFCIEQCSKAILQARFGYGSAFRTSLSLFLVLLTVSVLLTAAVFTHQTLVSRKVQLND